MSLSGLKDIDREILKNIDDHELLKICTLDRKTWNEVCDDIFLRRRLSKYPGIEKYKEKKESWKQFFLRFIYYTSKMKDKYKFIYTDGNFKKQYELLQRFAGVNLLTESASYGEPSLVKYAVKNGANVHYGGDAALRLATKYGHFNLVKVLIEELGSDIHAENSFPLILAAEQGRLDIVKYFLDHGANIHTLDDAPLRHSAANGNIEMVKFLVEHGANIHARNDEALSMAKMFGRKEVVAYLSSLY